MKLRLNSRKQSVLKHADQVANQRENWINKNLQYYKDDHNYMSFLIQPGQRVLDLGCGTGGLLAALSPVYGVGVDLSQRMIDIARSKHANLNFIQGDIEDPSVLAKIKGHFDAIILSDTIGYLDDSIETLKNLHQFCTSDTRIIIAYYAWFWEPILNFGEKFSIKMPSVEMSWLTTDDLMNLLYLADFKPVKREWRQIFPKRFYGVGVLINRFVGTLPIIRKLCLRNYLVGRSVYKISAEQPSVSVIIPCRNEKGNIENAIKRLPKFCSDIEIIFVEGHSTDSTLTEIYRVIYEYSDYDIKVFVQDGIGKGDAVRKGFANARGDILIILDADLTVPPEDIPKFYELIASGKGEFINGTRMVYPMHNQAMRFLNFLANRIFSLLFSWILNQRFTDTLCGTKAISKKNYLKIEANRSFFGDFDPLGDFDLIFGATKLNLHIVEVPIPYAAREYGTTQISRFRHGWLLLKMVIFAYRKLKINPCN